MIDVLSALDKSLFLFLNSFHSTWLNPLMLILSGQIIWIPFVGFFLLMAWKKLTHRQFFVFTLFLALVIFTTDVTASSVIKSLVQRLRPCRVEDLKPFIYHFGQKCGGRFGFISSHAGNSASIILFSVLTLNLNKKIFLLIWLLPILVSYSRIYLGVHYPGDILGGLIIGSFWAIVFSHLFKNNIYGANRNFSQT